MSISRKKKSFVISIVLHIGILLTFIFGFESISTKFVFENSNKTDVVSAVVLGDTAKSKILPKVKPPEPIVVKEEPKLTQPKPILAPIEKDVIALKKPDDKKKLAEKKLLDDVKQKNIFGKDLLADIQKQTKKQKQLAQKKLQKQLQKTIQEQAEKTLRNQLMDESIKLQAIEAKETQGIVNKYIPLIEQAIREHWIIPTQANKKLYCKLMIRVAPGGMVLDVQVTKTSGDPSLDSSARAAVMKASPLPVPTEANAFESFRQFELRVKPETILEG